MPPNFRGHCFRRYAMSPNIRGHSRLMKYMPPNFRGHSTVQFSMDFCLWLTAWK